MQLKARIKKVVAGGIFLLAVLLIVVGIIRGDAWTVWNNAKILCLTCIGIK
ncbi:hypothetical protein SAMN06265339_1249 [Desulfurobacterium pacificum]|uniref:Thioredoxin n=1 Tax=Desulfurobacterium pacificum TaxID=240166 RepID=A0ABY1NPP7_9BACT|nr:CD1871A family CXXC motif-containing protein [Desulfurobacterium pacificum]SMP14023.1 hypothetical protein SAMN06265339_1249 [Desulfurobacterium pacificum]